MLSVFFILVRPPSRSTLFPYTTLFRSQLEFIGGLRASLARLRELESGTRERNAEIAAIESDRRARSEEHTSELQSRRDLVCRLLLEKKKDQEPTSTPRADSRGRAEVGA